MLKIGDFSKLSRVSIRMLRYYDEIGLLNPVMIDEFTGYRYYSEEQLPIVGRITALKDMGFGLASIHDILNCYDNHEQLENYLNTKRSELISLQEETNHRLRLLDTAIEQLRKDDNMNYNVTVKTLPQRYVASVRMAIPCYEQECIVWNVLCEETDNMNLVPADPCCCSAAFHDREYKESDVDVEVQKTVKGSYPDTEHVKFKTVPEVTFASATYKGSYDLINEVNAAVAKWIAANGYEYNGLIFNIYHVSPAETQNPDEFVTEVCYPVKKK
ncbi:MAG: MerR family transcriptional regulator [Clostridia bacterium]|jgi:DNA-binding transcriptional MerR regulator|nr:MerR family transcriptional regulator [Clostridia bacterium]MCI2001165.1 MerR family transcriptional regulator [Clostridia bacterium]MCI2015855.1 MerR family transcriptional regulator [Clostridia bacterium]